MRLKNKKHTQILSRTDNKKYQEQNHKKEKTNNNNTIIVAIFIAFASTIQFSHNTPPHTQHPPTNSQRSCLPKRGDFIEQQSCCSRHPTACHKNKTNHQNTNTLAALQNPLQPIRLKKLHPVSSIPKTPHTSHEVCAVLAFT